MLVTPAYNERLQAPTTLLVIQTAASFASFRYDLTVRERRDGSTIRFTVLGLSASGSSMPGAGSARFTREFEDLQGDILFQLEGLDHEVTEWAVRVRPGAVSLIRPPSRETVRVFTSEQEMQA